METSSNNDTKEKDLISNIENYKVQLDQVSAALENAKGENQVQLQELQLNLITILELTLNELSQSQTEVDSSVKNNTQSSKNGNSSSDFDEEFLRFQREIADLEGNEEELLEEDEEQVEDREFSSKLKELESRLKQLEGKNMRAAFKERWGGFSYHNAVVLSIVSFDDPSFDYEKPEVSVLFSQPTSVSMAPCRFFLEGRCKFEEEGGCRFSHGYRVAVNDLMDYREPDREKLVSGSRVLALHEGQDIWHRGTIEDVLEGRKGFSLNCSVCNEVVEVELNAMVPLFADEDPQSAAQGLENNNTKSPAASEEEEEEEEEETAMVIPSDAWLNTSLSARLGEWEKHTKGIGSRLMSQMGYITGTGLGPKGEGRVDPVQVHIYPQGKSLALMWPGGLRVPVNQWAVASETSVPGSVTQDGEATGELREASDGGCILNVEKRLLKDQKKEEEKRKRQEKLFKENGAASVFDIINTKLNNKEKSKGYMATSGSSSGCGVTVNVSRSTLKKDTAKELRRKNLTLGTRIEKLKSEVTSLKNSKVRHINDSATLRAIDKKVEERIQEISALQMAERQVESEQHSRKELKKLCLF